MQRKDTPPEGLCDCLWQGGFGWLLFSPFYFSVLSRFSTLSLCNFYWENKPQQIKKKRKAISIVEVCPRHSYTPPQHGEYNETKTQQNRKLQGEGN